MVSVLPRGASNKKGYGSSFHPQRVQNPNEKKEEEEEEEEEGKEKEEEGGGGGRRRNRARVTPMATM